MLKRHLQRRIAAFKPAELEGRGQAERHRHHGVAVILLVLVLVQGEPRAGLVLIDQAGVRDEAGKARIPRRATRQFDEHLRHGRPPLAALGIALVVAIAAAVGHPAGAAAAGHGDRHLKTARCGHAAKRGLAGNRLDAGEQGSIDRQRAPAQQGRAVAQDLLAVEIEQVGHQGLNMATKIAIPIRWRSVANPRPAYVGRPTMEKIMVDTIRYATGTSSLGLFVAAASDGGLAMVEFGALSEAQIQARFPDAEVIEDTAFLAGTMARLSELIEQPEGPVDLVLDVRGSPFEVKVWEVLRTIPAGTTTTYGEIAARLGVPREAREVGEACAANKLALVVPCHRVVKKDGSLAGYRWGTRRKRALLEREQKAMLLQPFVAAPHQTATT